MKLLDMVICEDIRDEINNKFSLMGVFNNRIRLIPKDKDQVVWPIAMKLGFFLRMLPDDQLCNKIIEINFEVKKDEEKLLEMNGNIEIKAANEVLVLPIKVASLKVSGEGDWVFSFKFKEKDTDSWKNIEIPYKFKVEIAN